MAGEICPAVTSQQLSGSLCTLCSHCKRRTRAGEICPAVSYSSCLGHCVHCVLTFGGGQEQVRFSQLLPIAAATGSLCTLCTHCKRWTGSGEICPAGTSQLPLAIAAGQLAIWLVITSESQIPQLAMSFSHVYRRIAFFIYIMLIICSTPVWLAVGTLFEILYIRTIEEGFIQKRMSSKRPRKTASTARILSPNPMRRPSPCLLNKSFFYDQDRLISNPPYSMFSRLKFIAL